VVPDPTEGLLFRPVVYVRAGVCSLTSPNGCVTAPGYGGTASLTLPNLPMGNYAVTVDGAGMSSGKFTIKLQ
jgi:hypothetical protein